MISIFIPQLNKRIKTSVRGFWQNDNGKTYYDYITVKNFDVTEAQAQALSINLAQELQQEAIFYIADNKGIVFYNKDKKEVFNKQIAFHVIKKDLKYYIKMILKKYKALTVYKLDRGFYQIEVFYNV